MRVSSAKRNRSQGKPKIDEDAFNVLCIRSFPSQQRPSSAPAVRKTTRKESDKVKEMQTVDDPFKMPRPESGKYYSVQVIGEDDGSTSPSQQILGNTGLKATSSRRLLPEITYHEKSFKSKNLAGEAKPDPSSVTPAVKELGNENKGSTTPKVIARPDKYAIHNRILGWKLVSGRTAGAAQGKDKRKLRKHDYKPMNEKLEITLGTRRRILKSIAGTLHRNCAVNSPWPLEQFEYETKIADVSSSIVEAQFGSQLDQKKSIASDATPCNSLKENEVEPYLVFLWKNVAASEQRV